MICLRNDPTPYRLFPRVPSREQRRRSLYDMLNDIDVSEYLVEGERGIRGSRITAQRWLRGITIALILFVFFFLRNFINNMDIGKTGDNKDQINSTIII